jgi:hypothetical protein
MSNIDGFVLFDSVRDIKIEGDYSGSIITKLKSESDFIIFSDSVQISKENGLLFKNGLKIGFEMRNNNYSAFSQKITNKVEDFELIDFCIQIPDDVMQLYDEGQFSDTFPYTINMLHTAGLYLNDSIYGIDHLNFFREEILKNPISLIMGGIIIADRVVIDQHGDPVFYDCLIVGRDKNDKLDVSYEPLTNVDDKVVKFIIILGIEELKI